MNRRLGPPKRLLYALTALPISALWAVNVWAVTDYLHHRDTQVIAERAQALRDLGQDRDVQELRQQLERQQRVTCAIASRLKVVTLDCE